MKRQSQGREEKLRGEGKRESKVGSRKVNRGRGGIQGEQSGEGRERQGCVYV